MTNQEFSNQFDVLYNNVMSNQAPGLDEYEKSVFLTKAQNELVLSYFTPKGNKYMEGFDDSAMRQVDFSKLLRAYEDPSPSIGGVYDLRTSGVANVEIPGEVLLFINESVVVTRDKKATNLVVVPISYSEYSRRLSKPYKRPNRYQAWRLTTSIAVSDSVTPKFDIIAGVDDIITKYTARYVKRPRPIILSDLTSEDLTIDGISEVTSCELDPIIHKDILQRAVELAKAAYTGDLSSQVGLGVNSQTNLGIIPSGRG